MKRTILAVAMLTAFGGLQAAMAQDAYPNRLIKLIVPFAAGGNTDVVGRVTAAYMQKALKANVVVENRAGAGGINGTDVVAKAAPDGYTLCLCGIGPITVAPATEKLPYDPLKDLAPISLVNTNPLILIVNPKVEAKSGAELAALSKTTPGGLELRHRRLRRPDAVRGGDIPRQDRFQIHLGAVPRRRACHGRGGVRRGAARVLQHVGCDGADWRRAPCGRWPSPPPNAARRRPTFRR